MLHCPYTCEKAKLIVREMTDLLVLDLVDKGLVTDQMVLTIGYDVENLQGKNIYKGEVTTDHYGRKIPKHAHGTANLDRQTSSTKLIMDAVMELYDRIVNPDLLVRRINLTACKVVDESEANSIPLPVSSWTYLLTMRNWSVSVQKKKRRWNGRRICRRLFWN